MKTFENFCAQGDIYIKRIEALPVNAMEVKPEGGKVIVTHSETGHHHVMEATAVKMYRLPDSIMDCLLVVEQPTALEHLRQHDTHELDHVRGWHPLCPPTARVHARRLPAR
ncbi:MAG: hypothetical protein IPK23_14920 [Rhizobiales bacterium]|nr:hypothetical protein [Hyphomicrobiales bacterium]